MDLRQQFRTENEAWAARGLGRRLEQAAGIDFTTNDYLALSRAPEVIAAAKEALDAWGAGARAAPLLSGRLPPHADVERLAASWAGDGAALLFPSGWQANAALLTSLVGEGDVLFSDALNHASLIDGCRTSRADVRVFRHNDPNHLEVQLVRHQRARRRVVVCEHVYSMDGERAPLADYGDLALRYDAWLLVDEAHAVGLYPFPHHPRLLARMFTGGKALGVAGGLVCASRDVIETLVNRGRPFVYSTAMPPASAAALAAALHIAQSEPERAERAHAAAKRLRSRLAKAGLAAGGESPVVPVLVGSGERALRIAETLRVQGYDVRAVRPPTVPEGTSRLRIVCHADHADDQIDGLVDALVTAVATVSEEVAVAPAPRTAVPLVICGTDTDVGKTTVASRLVRALLDAGRDVRYFKPVQTGEDTDTPTVIAASGLDPARAPTPAVELPLPASVDQAAAAAGVDVSVTQVFEATRSHLEEHPASCWVLECAGGLRVPFNESEDQGDFLRQLGAPVLLVARSGLGTLNHTLLTVEALDRRGIPLRAVVLFGEPHPANSATLRQWLDVPVVEPGGLPDLGVLFPR